jgi:tRNA pseudouridine38-40 synthase
MLHPRRRCQRGTTPQRTRKTRIPATKLLIEYDGTRFAGWARQPGRRTVQDELERALAVLTRAPTATTAAGRTDAGVHALAQVASYAGHPVERKGLNAILPCDLNVLECTGAPTGFDARRDARSRAYEYRVLNRRTPAVFERGRALWWPQRIEREALHQCAAALHGTHDFTAFTLKETQHTRFTRTVQRALWTEHGDLLSFHIEANSFLRHMNRALVGTMLQVAMGRRTVENFSELLEGCPRADAGPSAAPHGLYLAHVRYDCPSGGESNPRLFS